jgi:hypothetical protein
MIWLLEQQMYEYIGKKGLVAQNIKNKNKAMRNEISGKKSKEQGALYEKHSLNKRSNSQFWSIFDSILINFSPNSSSITLPVTIRVSYSVQILFFRLNFSFRTLKNGYSCDYFHEYFRLLWSLTKIVQKKKKDR